MPKDNTDRRIPETTPAPAWVPTAEECGLVATLLTDRFNGYWIPANHPRSPHDLRPDQAKLREAVRIVALWLRRAPTGSEPPEDTKRLDWLADQWDTQGIGNGFEVGVRAWSKNGTWVRAVFVECDDGAFESVARPDVPTPPYRIMLREAIDAARAAHSSEVSR